MRVKVIRKKTGISRKDLKKILASLDKEALAVGFFESSRYDDGTPVAGVAAIQEFGAGKIPPRPFMRPVIEENSSEWPALVEPSMRAVVKGESDIEQALNILGAKISGEIRAKIASITSPPLSPVTLALRKLKRKGIDVTGATVGAVARAIAEGKTGPGELGDSQGINPKPLVFDGILIQAPTWAIEKKGGND